MAEKDKAENPAEPQKTAPEPVADTNKAESKGSGADDTVKTTAAPPPAAGEKKETPKAGSAAALGTELIGGLGGNPDPSGHLLDRKSTYRRWLESKSKDELIELIMGLEKDQPTLEVTEKMMKVQLTGPIASPSDSFKIPEDLPFLRLPVVRATPPNEVTPTWRIVLVSLEQNNKPVGLIIDSEITIGRTAGGATPDLDLTPFGASLKGVSRIHARLRPSMHSLALVDNNSSNGTYCNRSRIPPDTEQPLKEGDVIAFGQAYFLVRVVKSPDASEAKTLI